MENKDDSKQILVHYIKQGCSLILSNKIKRLQDIECQTLKLICNKKII